MNPNFNENLILLLLKIKVGDLTHYLKEIMNRCFIT